MDPKYTVNYAKNQERWDRREVSLDACYRKGREHAAYGWTANGLGFKASDEQTREYLRGYNEYHEPPSPATT